MKEKIKSDSGSIAPLAILGIMLTLSISLVQLSATTLFEQQRRLNSVSDALALDLADLALDMKQNIDGQLATQELDILNQQSGDGAKSWVASFSKSGQNRVSVRLCQRNILLDKPFTNALGRGVLPDVCVASTAENR